MTRWTKWAWGPALAGLIAFGAPPAGAAPTRVSDGIRFTFADANAKAVYWVGDFNAWNMSAAPMAKGTGGAWEIVIALPPGQHAYKFYVDGQWIADPGNSATVGEFGNSAVTVGPNGDLVTMAATSNTPYSPKIAMTGRVIGLYQASHNAETDRYELRRPLMDVDLSFDTRFSDALQARWLMNLTSQREATELLATTLDFDRGSLLLSRPQLRVFAFDNDGVPTWSSGPLPLVGDVGIYAHPFGYGRQGFALTTRRWGVAADALYADNFDRGGTTYPAIPPVPIASLFGALPLRATNTGYELVPGGRNKEWVVNENDLNEDMFALRLSRELAGGFTLGAQGRSDRGYNLGSIVLAESRTDGTIDVLGGSFEQQWFALGPEVKWTSPARGLEVSAGYLHGLSRFALIGTPQRWTYRYTGVDTSGPTGVTNSATTLAGAEHRTLDASDRFALHAAWRAAHGDLGVRGGIEFQDHAYELESDGLANSMTVWSFGWDRDWRRYLGRPLRTQLDVEYTALDYEAGTPWDYQLWFPQGNFWLESGEHMVRFDRMTLLGGDDVVSVHPRLMLPLHSGRRATFEYEGRINATSLGNRPKYAESLFRFGVDLTPALRLSTDSRWVKYDAPALGLGGGFLAHFGELAYTFAPGIQLAFSVGVDPWEIDGALNEYRPIGRDQFLFARGANGAIAASNYLGLGSFFGVRGAIETAERALEQERRFQVRALMRF